MLKSCVMCVLTRARVRDCPGVSQAMLVAILFLHSDLFSGDKRKICLQPEIAASAGEPLVAPPGGFVATLTEILLRHIH